MCGIAGLIRPSGKDLRRVASALEELAHRGPDDWGVFTYTRGSGIRAGRFQPQAPAEVVLMHRRLSIIDLTDAGWQPMGTRDGRYFITYNGEIYNHVELRDELEQLGHKFESRSDTEVLLAAYAQWGAKALPRLVGMFAFGILDTVQRVLFLARDCFGIKPLYYTITPDSLAFASELKTLLQFGSARQVNPDRLFEYLRFGLCDYGSDTLLSDVFQLAAANYLEIHLDEPLKARPKSYWRPVFQTRNDLSFEEAAQKLRELFLKSVHLHLRSDVPVGAALSGGIDSSSVVMAMRHLQPELELHTFSYIADDPALSEERWVDIAGSAAHAHVHKIRPTPQELLADFDGLTYALDWPSGSTTLYAQYRVFRAAREAGIKVMLDGQGADEILGGYRYFLAARLASLVRQRRLAAAAQFLRNASQWSGMDKKMLACIAADYLLPASAQLPLRRFIGKDLAPAWLNEGWFRERGVYPRPHRYSANQPEVLKESLCRDLTENLPNLLRYEDRNSMAFSIESRVPFLTPELVDLILSLPEEYIIAPDGTSKAVFRRATRGLVPDEILDRTDKIGFATPERRWLSTLNVWVRRVLENGVASKIPAFNSRVVSREWEHMESGRRPLSAYVWRCLNVIRWTERFQVQYQ